MVRTSVAMNPFFEKPASNYPDVLFLTIYVDDVMNQGLVTLSPIGAIGVSLEKILIREEVAAEKPLGFLHFWVCRRIREEVTSFLGFEGRELLDYTIFELQSAISNLSPTNHFRELQMFSGSTNLSTS